MENKIETFHFKTNINCGGCIAAVKPFLDNAVGLSQWEVDVQNKDKILTVASKGITKEQVIATIEKAGYKIELLNE
ncbi:MAG: heavy-metal-associated domain-containing protein [Saprospiraceae bacterium]|nr:heavy-metal-associated domain-containing protein [Saprospiraceae bacterium]